MRKMWLAEEDESIMTGVRRRFGNGKYLDDAWMARCIWQGGDTAQLECKACLRRIPILDWLHASIR